MTLALFCIEALICDLGRILENTGCEAYVLLICWMKYSVYIVLSLVALLIFKSGDLSRDDNGKYYCQDLMFTTE